MEQVCRLQMDMGQTVAAVGSEKVQAGDFGVWRTEQKQDSSGIHGDGSKKLFTCSSLTGRKEDIDIAKTCVVELTELESNEKKKRKKRGKGNYY